MLRIASRLILDSAAKLDGAVDVPCVRMPASNVSYDQLLVPSNRLSMLELVRILCGI